MLLFENTLLIIATFCFYGGRVLWVYNVSKVAEKQGFYMGVFSNYFWEGA